MESKLKHRIHLRFICTYAHRLKLIIDNIFYLLTICLLNHYWSQVQNLSFVAACQIVWSLGLSLLGLKNVQSMLKIALIYDRERGNFPFCVCEPRFKNLCTIYNIFLEALCVSCALVWSTPCELNPSTFIHRLQHSSSKILPCDIQGGLFQMTSHLKVGLTY